MSWRDIWEARSLGSGTPLEQLMAADGFDGFASMDESAWRAYLLHVGDRLGLAPPASLYEVGCGAGAFLLPWHQAGCSVAGLDRSQTLLGFARSAMPGARFDEGEAAALGPEPSDFVVSNGVFLYFPSLEYAQSVLERMAGKARRAIAVLDIPDLARKEVSLAMRRGALGPAEYDAKYRGLDHLYIDRSWLESALRQLGFARILIEDQAIPGYAHAPYRYNVFAFQP